MEKNEFYDKVDKIFDKPIILIWNKQNQIKNKYQIKINQSPRYLKSLINILVIVLKIIKSNNNEKNLLK